MSDNQNGKINRGIRLHSAHSPLLLKYRGRGDLGASRSDNMTGQREVVVPGVGIWTPRGRWLEGDARKVGEHQQSFKRLTVHVHNLIDLDKLLENTKLANVEVVRLDYCCDFSLSNLRWALADCTLSAKKLRSLQICGKHTSIPETWQCEQLLRMYGCLANARLFMFGKEIGKKESYANDEVIWEDDSWFRVNGDEIAVPGFQLPWVESDIADRKPKSLVVDCEDQFMGPSLGSLTDGSFDTVELLSMYNVKSTVTTFLGWVDKIDIPALREFHLYTQDDDVRALTPVLKAWFARKPNLKGASYYLNA